MSWQWLTSTWRPLSLSQLCVFLLLSLSIWLYSYLTWSVTGGVERGDYTDCYSCVSCLFVYVCTDQMHVSWFIYTFLQPCACVPCWLLTSPRCSNKPAGIGNTASDICVSRVCVCICVSVCMWGKVESRVERFSSSVTGCHYLCHLLIIASPRGWRPFTAKRDTPATEVRLKRFPQSSFLISFELVNEWGVFYQFIFSTSADVHEPGVRPSLHISHRSFCVCVCQLVLLSQLPCSLLWLLFITMSKQNGSTGEALGTGPFFSKILLACC